MNDAHEAPLFEVVGRAQQFIARYCCAACWGHLVIIDERREDRKVTVHCHQCGAGRGFVTQGYAERRIAESAAEYEEAKNNIGKVIGLQTVKKSADQILQELYS